MMPAVCDIGCLRQAIGRCNRTPHARWYRPPNL